MIGPELQKAIVDALNAAPALCDGRVYDGVPPEAKRISDTGAAWPYITVGDEQVIDSGNSCGDGWEVFPDVHIWTRPESRSKREGKALMAAAVDRLRAITAVDGYTVTSVSLETARSFRDPDGITEHGAVTLRFLLDSI